MSVKINISGDLPSSPNLRLTFGKRPERVSISITNNQLTHINRKGITIPLLFLKPPFESQPRGLCRETRMGRFNGRFVIQIDPENCERAKVCTEVSLVRNYTCVVKKEYLRYN